MPQSKQQAGTVKSLSVFSTLGKVRHGGGLVAKLSLTLAIPWSAVHQTPKSLGFRLLEGFAISFSRGSL